MSSLIAYLRLLLDDVEALDRTGLFVYREISRFTQKEPHESRLLQIPEVAWLKTHDEPTKYCLAVLQLLLSIEQDRLAEAQARVDEATARERAMAERARQEALAELDTRVADFDGSRMWIGSLDGFQLVVFHKRLQHNVPVGMVAVWVVTASEIIHVPEAAIADATKPSSWEAIPAGDAFQAWCRRFERFANCYGCRNALDWRVDPICSICHWMACSLCQACGCDYQRTTTPRSPVELR